MHGDSFFDDRERFEFNDLVDRILTMQAGYSWPKDAESPEDIGLRDARRVLDVGTGNGRFLCRLAQRHPGTHFVGVEMSEPLVALARESARAANVPNVEVIHDRCPAPSVDGTFDFVVARLAIYCATNREDVLSWVHDMLEIGGKIGVIDLDYDLLHTYPHDPLIGKLFSVHLRELELHGADCSIGRKPPFLLRQAGFQGIRCEMKSWWSSFELSPEQFLSLFSAYGLFSVRVAPEAFSDADFVALQTYLRGVASERCEAELRLRSAASHDSAASVCGSEEGGTVVYPLFVAGGTRPGGTKC